MTANFLLRKRDMKASLSEFYLLCNLYDCTVSEAGSTYIEFQVESHLKTSVTYKRLKAQATVPNVLSIANSLNLNFWPHLMYSLSKEVRGKYCYAALLVNKAS